MMQYKGYLGETEVDDEAGVIHGTLAGIRAVITFEGSTVEEARQAFHDSVDFYLDLCAKRGTEPDRPFSGRLLVRIPPVLHRDATLAARRHDMSLNKFVEQALNAATVPIAQVAPPSKAKVRHKAKGSKPKAVDKKVRPVEGNQTAPGKFPVRATKAEKVKQPAG